MDKFKCIFCGHIYDESKGEPSRGVAPGTKWDDMPAGFVCPRCGLGKRDQDQFYLASEDE